MTTEFISVQYILQVYEVYDTIYEVCDIPCVYVYISSSFVLLDNTLLKINYSFCIIYQVPDILMHHEVFLEELRRRLEHWDIKQRVGDIFLETVSMFILKLILCYFVLLVTFF